MEGRDHRKEEEDSRLPEIHMGLADTSEADRTGA